MSYLCLVGICSALVSCAGVSKQAPLELGEMATDSINTELPNLPEDVEWQAINNLSDDATPWWQQFDDPTLHEIIKSALDNSQDLALAIARLDELAAAAGAARSARYPALTFNSSMNISGNDANESITNTTNAGFALNWQSDLFGELRNVSKSAQTRMQAQEYRVRDAQRLLVSQLVQNYYRLISIRERIDLTQTSVDRRRKNLDRINELLAQGYATSLDKTRTQSQLYDAQAALAQLELEEVTLLNQIAILVGTDLLNVRHVLKTTPGLPEPNSEIPLPSIDLLVKHRPDLRVVERELVAAAYDVNGSIASLYPTLGFQANLGMTGTVDAFTSLPALNVLTGGILTNLAMPILNRGRLLAQVDQSSARLKQAHIAFEQAALRAIAEIDTSLLSISKYKTLYELRSLASESSREASESSRELFKAGELDYTSVILAEQTRFNDENNAVSAKHSYLDTYIQYLSAVAPVW